MVDKNTEQLNGLGGDAYPHFSMILRFSRKGKKQTETRLCMH